MQTQCKCEFLSIIYSAVWFYQRINISVYVYFVLLFELNNSYQNSNNRQFNSDDF